MSKKICVVLTCYNRLQHLQKTLQTIAENTTHPDYHIIVVDDASREPVPQSVVPGDLIRIEPSQKTWTDIPVPANMGVLRALTCKPDIIIVQNAECYHVGDVISFADANVVEENVISFACWAAREVLGPMSQYSIWDEIAQDMRSGNTGWYNHPNRRPVGYPFCAAMTTQAMIELNGYDERFAYGMGYSDDDWVRRIRLSGRGLRLTTETSPFVVHVHHERSYIPGGEERNRSIFGTVRNETKVAATHIITEDFKWDLS